MASPPVDPRAIITPDSFGVAPELLGLPLARPARRAAAMAVDLIAVGLLTQVSGVFFGILAAAALWRASATSARAATSASAGTPATSTGSGMSGISARAGTSARAAGVVRGSVRILLRATAAIVIFIVVLNVIDNIGERMGGDDDEDDTAATGTTVGLCGDASVAFDLSDLSSIPLFVALDESRDPASADAAAVGITEWLRRKQLDDAQVRASLQCLAEGMESGEARAALETQIAALAPAHSAGSDSAAADSAGTEAADTDAPRAALPATPDSALLAYAQARIDDDTAAMRALDSVARAAVAGDRIAELEEGYEEVRAENASLRTRIERFGFTDRIRSIVTEDLGVGFGWIALYFTSLIALFRGQTLGKRIFGLRVIRLDGRPISWWISFERFGGYAASLSTGLLGFLQILWDRNRQGLHDKAVETVVIRILPGADYIAGRGATIGARVGGVRQSDRD